MTTWMSLPVEPSRGAPPPAGRNTSKYGLCEVMNGSVR